MSPKTLELLEKLNPSIQIFQILSDQMSDSMLRIIAKADYGNQEKACFKLLKEIVITQKMPSKVEFILGECLELTRWSIPKDKEEHIIRAFSTTLLLILEATSDLNSLDENSTLAAFIDSNHELNLCKLAQKLLVWRLLQDYQYEISFEEVDDKNLIDEYDLDEFKWFGLFILLIFNQENEEIVSQVVEIILHQDKSYLVKENFLLGRTNFNQRFEIWKSLTSKLIEHKNYIRNEELLQKIDKIIDCVVKDKIMY